MYNNKTILVTGGTGSFGQSYVKFLLKNFTPKKVIVFSRDELKQFNMHGSLSEHRNLRFFLGDIRDLPRLQRAFQGVDIVVHAAALKQVPALEYNPFEAIQTNIIGSQNIVTAALDRKVKRVLLISTDKAAQPVNLYGATKMCAEKLFISSNVYNLDAKSPTRFSAVRYGNVFGSRGSVVETISNSDGKEPLKLTHREMTRFWITLDQCFELVTHALSNMVGGEIFVPKVPSMKIEDLFTALAPNRKIKVVGIRPGEKIHEVLLTKEEARNAVDTGKYYVVLPHYSVGSKSHDKYTKHKKLSGKDFTYCSDTNGKWLDKSHIMEMISKK